MEFQSCYFKKIIVTYVLINKDIINRPGAGRDGVARDGVASTTSILKWTSVTIVQVIVPIVFIFNLNTFERRGYK